MPDSEIFYARETSGNANATTLVISPQNAITLQFTTENPNTPGPDNGNLILETSGPTQEGDDPNTWVVIGGQTYSFTYDIVGTSNSSAGNNNSWPEELRGKQIAVIRTVVGNYFFVLDGSGTQSLMNQIKQGQEELDPSDPTPGPTPVCFCAGTDIGTPSGPRKVEALVAGDMVLTDTGKARQVVWVGRTRYAPAALRQNPDLRPIVIPADAMGPGLPAADLHVSPQHRIVLQNAACELLFGTDTVLVPAKFLVGSLAEVAPVTGPVDYFHVLLEDHDMLVSNGLATESFQPARRTMDVMDDAARTTLEGVIAALGAEEMLTRKDQFLSLKRPEAKVLLDRLHRHIPSPDRARGETGSVGLTH